MKADLERANAAIANADWGAALELLLDAWREKRVGRLADVIDRVSERVDHAPIAVKSVTERNGRWLALAAKKQTRDVGTLLATPWPKKWQDGTPMMEALEQFPDDPRIGMALARIVEATPTDSWASYAFYRPILRVVARTADPRAKLVLAADLAKEKSRFWNQRNRQLVVDAHAAIADAPALTASEEKVLAALEARFTTEFKAARTTAKSEADFLAAIYAAPTDDTPRAVYADWLTERDDERGEFITLQLTPSPTPATKKRQATLLRKYGKAWAGPLDKIISKEGRVFTRGFLSHAVIDSMQKAAVAQALAHPEWALVESLSFGHGGRLAVRGLFTQSWRKNLRAVHGVPAEYLSALAGFDSLEELHLHLDDATVLKPLTKLTAIKRYMIDADEEGFMARLEGPLPPKLERLIVIQWLVKLADVADAAFKAKVAAPVVEVRREYYARGVSNERYELRRGTNGRFTRLRVSSLDGSPVHPKTLAAAKKSLPGMTELVVV